MSYSSKVVVLTDMKKLVLAALLALAAVVGVSLALSKLEGKSATGEKQSVNHLVTRANDAANQAAEEFNRGT